MDLHQLRMLRELAERGSVAAVAEAMFISPSAVSQHLTALQRTVRIPLTRKQGRSLVLTEAGQALAAAAVEVDRAMAMARNAVDRYLDDDSTVVTVSAFHSAARVFLPRLAALHHGQGGPLINGADEDVATERFVTLAGNYDLVIAHRLDAGPPWPQDRVTVTPLLHEPIDIALAAGHPLAARDVLTPADLAGVEWVSPQEGFPAASVIDAIAGVVGEPPSIRYRINDLPTAVAIVAASGAVGLLPRYTSHDLLGAGIVSRPVAGVDTRRRVDLLSRPDRIAQRAVAEVAASLRRIAEELTAAAAGQPAEGEPAEG